VANVAWSWKLLPLFGNQVGDVLLGDTSKPLISSSATSKQGGGRLQPAEDTLW
jgi:hypothetical protein